MMSIIQAVFGKTKSKKSHQSSCFRSQRPLRLEALEERQMLAVCFEEFGVIRSVDSETCLTADMNNDNLYELTSLNDTLLRPLTISALGLENDANPYDETGLSLSEAYPDLNLPEDLSGYNIIEISDLSETALRDAISVAGTTVENDLIVLHTTDQNNKITLSGTELSINIDALQFGSVTIVSLGSANLTIDANQQSRVLEVTNGSTVFLGGVILTQGNNNLVSGQSGTGYGGAI